MRIVRAKSRRCFGKDGGLQKKDQARKQEDSLDSAGEASQKFAFEI